jgi:exo-beta-1,3-glucanase (GH17 family)
MSYAPYNSDGSCKTADQIKSDFDAFDGYGTLRIYGTDCDQVANVLPAASARNMKLFAGVWDVSDVSSEIQTIISAAKGNWDAIDTISIGNEAVNSGTATVDQVVSAVNTARSLLSAAGYNGKVVTVDTFNQIIANPQLCQASDFAAANCHAFFDSSISASQAGSYVKEQAQQVQKACGGMDTVITESGWPSNGDTNGAAVPSEANQKAAISSLRSAFSDNLILFSAFNDYWKDNFPGSFNAEHYWGIYGNAPA